MLSTKNYWLYLEPYIHLSIKDNEILLYNTLSQKHLFYTKEKIKKIIDELIIPENLFCIYFKGTDLCDPEIYEFVKNLRALFMGDIIDVSYSKSKPIQFVPKLNNQNNIEILKSDRNRSLGEQVMTYLNEITIQVNNKCDLSCTHCSQLYRQTLFCSKNNSCDEIEIENIEKIVNELQGSGLQKINIVGGDVFLYNNYQKLIVLLNKSFFSCSIYVHIHNLFKNINLLSGMVYIDLIEFSILVNSIDYLQEIEAVHSRLTSLNIKHDFTFTIINEKEFKQIDEFISTNNFSNYNYIPIYTLKDFGFFKANSFLSKADILSNVVTQKDIHRNMQINTNDFGKLFITADGEVYANLHFPALGCIKDKFRGLVYKEMDEGNSWRRIRDMKPCCNCVYQWLCPSPSNYELAIGKPNLCHVRS